MESVFKWCNKRQSVAIVKNGTCSQCNKREYVISVKRWNQCLSVIKGNMYPGKIDGTHGQTNERESVASLNI